MVKKYIHIFKRSMNYLLRYLTTRSLMTSSAPYLAPEANIKLRRTFLKEIKFNFSVWSRSERSCKVVLKGFTTDSNIDTIKAEVSRLRFAVHRISLMRNFTTKDPYRTFLCYIYKSEAFPRFFQMGYMLEIKSNKSPTTSILILNSVLDVRLTIITRRFVPWISSV